MPFTLPFGFPTAICRLVGHFLPPLGSQSVALPVLLAGPLALHDLGLDPALELVADRALLDLDVEILQRSEFGTTRRFTVRATRAQLKRTAHIAGVSWIEESAEITMRNAHSRWVVQTGEPGVTSLWERGLHGEGQIIGHIDGPIYYKSCFFNDPSVSAPGPGHRKIVAYRAYSSTSEAHGTHTAGTLAGDSSNAGGSMEGTMPAVLNFSIMVAA